MEDKTMLSAVFLGDESISWLEVCQQYDISEDWFNDLVEHGFFELKTELQKQARIDAFNLKRIQAALRLREDLDLNTAGIVMVVELTEKLDKLQEELAILKRHLEA